MLLFSSLGLAPPEGALLPNPEALKELSGASACGRPGINDYWLVGTHHKTGTVLFDSLMHKAFGWGAISDTNSDRASSLPGNDKAAAACAEPYLSGFKVAESTKPSQESVDKEAAESEKLQPMELPTPWLVQHENATMRNNFFLDAKCVQQWRQDERILRLRVMLTTPESWPVQLETFRKQTKSGALKVVHAVRDPLDIIISGYFYDAAGSEPECRNVPSTMLHTAQHHCGDHNGEVCTALRKIDYKKNSWSDALRKLPPKHGVMAAALYNFGDLHGEARTAAALQKQSFAQAHQVDLGDVMGKFDSTVTSLMQFLGVEKAAECAQEIKFLDISSGRKESTFTSCIDEVKKNGTDVSKLEGLLHDLHSKNAVNEENWYSNLVEPVEQNTPAQCSPCGYVVEPGEKHHAHCHSANGALDPVRENVRAALKASVFYQKQLNPLRAIMGYK